jgi:hypothetical protein
MPPPEPARARHIEHLHQLYSRLTGQNLSLRFDRQRFWYEFLQAGFTEPDLEQVITYLQREIRAGRRNVGALKLSNLLQLDRFEEDLNISHVRLRSPPPRPPSPSCMPPKSLSSSEQQQGREKALWHLRQLKKDLGLL